MQTITRRPVYCRGIVILEKGTNDVYKLANFHTGRVMKNFVHVDKLRNCQGARADRNAASTTAAINKGTRPVTKNNDKEQSDELRPILYSENRSIQYAHHLRGCQNRTDIPAR